jgi:hypothetical protein
MLAVYPGPKPVPKDARQPTREEKKQFDGWVAKMDFLHTALVVVFVQDNDKIKRECVKHWGDVKSGFPTQILVGTATQFLVLSLTACRKRARCQGYRISI